MLEMTSVKYEKLNSSLEEVPSCACKFETIPSCGEEKTPSLSRRVCRLSKSVYIHALLVIFNIIIGAAIIRAKSRDCT